MGGAEANASITAAELVRRGHSAALVHGPGTGNNEPAWHAIFQQTFALDAAPENVVKRALAEFGPDVVYVHKMADLRVIQTLVASGVPLVRMVHDHDIYCMRSYKYNYFTRRICTRGLTPYCLFPCGAFVARNSQGRLPIKYVSYRSKRKEVELNRRFQRVVVVSEYMKQELIRNGFDEARIEIHPPVPRMADRSIRSSFSDRNLILFAGQIIRGKGVDVLLRALALVKSPFQCVILGDGGHRRACEHLAVRLGLGNRVTFQGFVPQDQLKDYYRECSLIAVSSVWPEPIATIGLEAMRYALPVVAFDAGGIRDWLLDGHNGILVPWMDHVRFAAGVDRLLSDKALAREMGQRGLALADQRFGFERYISDLEEMFSSVLREKGFKAKERKSEPA